ncbi:2-carboxy-1,4-naphthoquinone phytyltransferase [Spirulina subsalsa]|nr:2-carboxy-1,4-naphthoquinone phytyltransferase [Spirulina subsalsa]
MTTTNFSPESRRELWWAAIKPPMYTVAITPISVATAAVYGATGQINGFTFGLFLVSAIAVIAWINLSNDVFDSETGIDQNKAHSVVNLTGNKALVFWLSNACLLVGIGGIGAIAYFQQDWRVLGAIALACALGYTYQGPPFRLGYQGLGELICLITFGPLTFLAVCYSQASPPSPTLWGASLFVGISTAIILFCSHFHQVEDDLAAGKRSPIVRLGTAKGSTVLAVSTVSLYILTPLFILCGYFSPWTLLLFLTVPVAYELVNHVGQYHNQPDKVRNCKFIAVKLHFWTGLCLSLGLIL